MELPKKVSAGWIIAALIIVITQVVGIVPDVFNFIEKRTAPTDQVDPQQQQIDLLKQIRYLQSEQVRETAQLNDKLEDAALELYEMERRLRNEIKRR